MMTFRSITGGGFALILFVALSLVVAAAQPASKKLSGTPVEQAVRGHATPEGAAADMFRACSTRDHRLFIRTHLLSVCEGKNDWPNRYADLLHTTTFASGNGEVTVYDLPKRMKANTVRAISSQEFSVNSGLLASSYYAEQFMSVEVVAANYDGLEYRSRIVVGRLSDRWYAIPRGGSSTGFYEIADALPSAAP